MPDTLKLTQIRTDGGTQARARLDPATVSEYTEAHRDGATFPPVIVYYDGGDYWLADGFHRLAAYRERLGTSIAAEVRQGTRRDAVLHACGANADHGLRRTNADKERAVLALLSDPEWQQWSDREIARRCRVSHPFVAKLRERTGNISSARQTADGRVMETTGIRQANEARTAAHVQQAVEEQGIPIPVPRSATDYLADAPLPPLGTPGVAALKTCGWRLDTRISPDRYRVIPPDGRAADVVTDEEAAVLAAEDQARMAVLSRSTGRSAPNDVQDDQAADHQARIDAARKRGTSAFAEAMETNTTEQEVNPLPPLLPPVLHTALAEVGWEMRSSRWADNHEAVYVVNGPHPQHEGRQLTLAKTADGVRALVATLTVGQNPEPKPEPLDGTMKARLRMHNMALLNSRVVDGQTRYVIQLPSKNIAEWPREELTRRLDLLDVKRAPVQAPPRPPRPAPLPRKPKDAGVSAQLDYLRQLEDYATRAYEQLVALHALLDRCDEGAS